VGGGIFEVSNEEWDDDISVTMTSDDKEVSLTCEVEEVEDLAGGGKKTKAKAKRVYMDFV
jgi:hypothetical protein